MRARATHGAQLGRAAGAALALAPSPAAGHEAGPRPLALPDAPTAPGSIAPAEWRWLAAVGAALGVLLAVPYAVWLLAGRADLVHVGSFWYPRDFMVYLAAMRQGAEGAGWLIVDRFTPEPHAPVFMFPVYVALGKLATLVGAPLLAVYYVAEWGGRLALLAALYVFAAAFLPTVGQRRLALGLMLMGTNLGLWVALALLAWRPELATSGGDVLALGASLEVMTLGVFLAPLHLMLGLACTLLAVAAYAAATAPGAGPRAYALLGAASLGLGLVHPFNLPIVVGVFAVDAAVELVRTRRWPLRAALAVAVAGGVALPFVAYNYATFRLDPFWSVVYSAQNEVPSPAPPRLLVDLGPVLLLAPLALRAWPRPWTGSQRLALLWAALLLLALYTPVPFQRRLAFGLQPGLAVLAAAGLAWLGARLTPAAGRRLAIALLLAGLPTAAFLYAGMVLSAATNYPVEVYVARRDEWVAGEWLAARMAPDEVVLATEESGFWLAALVPGRVFLGHKGITYDVAGKRAAVDAVLAGPPEAVASRLAAHGVHYLYYGPRERARGDLAGAPGLVPLYQAPEIAIYRRAAP